MPSPQAIDFDQIADGVTAVLNERAQRAQAAQRDAERQANEQAQRQAEADRARDMAKHRAEFEQLCEQERALKTEIDSKIAIFKPLHRDLSALGARHSQLLSERNRMQQQFPFLENV